MKYSGAFRYWILPTFILVPLIVMYFSGIPWAREFVCPSINWELGAPENLQLLLLFFIFIISAIAFFRKELRAEKILFLFLAIFTLFVFVEEIDYGAHFLRYFKGHDHTTFRELTGKPNIHNLGNNARIFKRSIYPFMGILFIIAPLLKERFRNPVIRYLIPSRKIIITAIITILSYIIPSRGQKLQERFGCHFITPPLLG